MSGKHQRTRFFTSYTGVALPLKMVGEITPEEMQNRNTFFEADFDSQGRLSQCRKFVYGELELEHRYHYSDSGKLHLAEVRNDGDEFQYIYFDGFGSRIAEV